MPCCHSVTLVGLGTSQDDAKKAYIAEVEKLVGKYGLA